MTTPEKRVRITESIDLNLDTDMWQCNRCNHELIDAHENYKKGTLLYNRDPREVHQARLKGEYTFAPDPNWVRIIEFYCPNCGTQLETEYLPPGHPITHDIEIDLDSLKRRLASNELIIRDGQLRSPASAGEGAA